MANILEILKFLPALIIAVMALVKTFEVPGNGENKKSAVLIVVGLIFDLFDILGWVLPLAKDKALDFVGKAIDAIVAFLNAIGKFTHSKNINPT